VVDVVTGALQAFSWLVDLGPARIASTQAAAKPTHAAAAAHPGSTKSDSTTATATTPPLQFEVNGRTVDIQAYTRFLRQLEASPWIADVTPVSAQTVVEKERPVTAFTIRATFRQADSAYIRTVPLSQSVR
jgi:hypothetical protein